ncbi:MULTISPECIES: maleylpyruvate isomerase N-terminal domain-containing protein [unclassified Mycolicibacterium]|uniref:maleylpyruvate isomerase N-terminal domain-containing protein n=1 Tax=unclassified Mycolicibacterium TaxID=2636767 RepID=UPI002EDB2A89
MSLAGIEGMRAAGADLVAVAATLTPQQWETGSAAAGWSVKDVFIHIGTLLELLQTAVAGAEAPPVGVETLNNMVVAGHRDWTTAQTVDFLQAQLDSAVLGFTAMQQEPLACTVVPMLDLGSYPLHSIVDMFTFDMITHLRWDVLAPRGPIPDQLAPLDDVRLTPAVSWLIGGLAQMQPELAAHVQAPIALQLTGSGARTLVLSRGACGVDVNEEPQHLDGVAATISSTTRDFLAWSTTRVPWPPVTTIIGDRAVAVDFLNTVNLI